MRFLNHTQRWTTFSRTPLDKSAALRRDLYLTTHNTHNRQTSMTPAGFEPTISSGERPPTCALEFAPTGTGNRLFRRYKNSGSYYAGVQNLKIPSAGPRRAALVRKRQEKKVIVERNMSIYCCTLLCCHTVLLAI